MKDYLKDVIVSNINKTIKGPRATYGEYLRWLGLWFLILIVIGPSCDAFFHINLVRKLLARDLIYNQYLIQEQNKLELRRSKRQATITAHALVSLPP